MIKKILIGILLLILISSAGLFLWLHESKPTGSEGAEAEALARSMMTAIADAKWDSTGAIRWHFAGRHKLLWDKRRHFARVRWDDNEVFIRINERSGVAYQANKRVTGEAADELVDTAWRYWVNDSFWLNPISKLFDDGTTRELIMLENGQSGLLVTYNSGGATPGDSYLWIVGDDGLPTSWKMWVGMIPFGGLEFTWENWQTLSTGVKISTLHQSKFVSIHVTDVKAAPTVQALEGNDPFTDLLK